MKKIDNPLNRREKKEHLFNFIPLSKLLMLSRKLQDNISKDHDKL